MRSRVIAVFAQFGGSHCYGSRTETRPCETTKGCPLEDGCGDRFRCRSGQTGICATLVDLIMQTYRPLCDPQGSVSASLWCVTETRTVRKTDLMNTALLSNSSHVKKQLSPQTLRL